MNNRIFIESPPRSGIGPSKFVRRIGRYRSRLVRAIPRVIKSLKCSFEVLTPSEARSDGAVRGGSACQRHATDPPTSHYALNLTNLQLAVLERTVNPCEGAGLSRLHTKRLRRASTITPIQFVRRLRDLDKDVRTRCADARHFGQAHGSCRGGHVHGIVVPES